MNYNIKNALDNQTYIHKALLIYDSLFPPSQREDKNKIIKNIKNKKYKMFIYIDKSSIVKGFFIIDINNKLNYTILTFLGVQKDFQRLGVGKALLLFAIKQFYKNNKTQFFLIEADNRPALLYKKYKFKTLNINYQIPCFDTNDTKKTNLLIREKDVQIQKEQLKDIIKDIFIYGYMLDERDDRLKNQLNSIYK